MNIENQYCQVEKKPWVPYTMPKAEMHVHISLALSSELFIRRVQYKRTDLNTGFMVERDKRYYPDLQDFHATYESMRHITSNERELAEIVQNYLERIAREGSIYAEISLSYRPGALFETQIHALEAAIETARHNTGIETRIVVTSLRDAGAEVAEEAVKQVKILNSPYVTAFGLVGNEAVNPMIDFKRAMHDAWHDAGLGLVPHVAEQRIENALNFLRAVPDEALKKSNRDHRKLRAGHGTLIHRSSELMKLFADYQICLEVCLSANNRIGVPADIENAHKDGKAYSHDNEVSYELNNPLQKYFHDLQYHPLPKFLEAGIPVCLGSDNPLLMNTNIGKEYSLSRKYAGCSVDDCLQFTKNAIRFANIDATSATRLQKLISDYETKSKAGIIPDETALGYREAIPSLSVQDWY
jgi:adenosine deaminase